MNQLITTLHIFCRVVDNFGDIGVCWRLCRQLHSEHGFVVHLWVDDLSSFQVLCAQVRTDLAHQTVQQVQIHHWQDALEANQDWHAVAQADVIIEAFACEVPAVLVQAMAMQARQPRWINLDYLSAESWVAGCHGLPSVHPQLGLTKYFYFPGFDQQTGGLLVEANYAARQQAFFSAPDGRARFLSEQFSSVQNSVWADLQRVGTEKNTEPLVFSLFCYPDAPVAALLAACANAENQSLCLVAEGVATAALGDFFGEPVAVGRVYQRGALVLFVLPFMSQASYDQLLWSCDLNFVRGEDSFVRAQLAGKPFVWQIYPQEAQAHFIKLDAFLQQYLAQSEAAEPVLALWSAWNQAPQGEVAALAQLPLFAAQLQAHARDWAKRLLQSDDLATRLVQFIEKIS